MSTRINFFVLLITGLAAISFPISAQISELPLLEISQLEYEGGFRLSASGFGSSSLNYSEGPVEYNAARHSMFIVGHSHHQNIAEFYIPELVKSDILEDLSISDSAIQVFSPVLDRTPDGNPDLIDRIGGMEIVDHNDSLKLIVNGYEYYDAPGNNTLTTILIEDATDIENSDITGYVKFAGGAGHTSGWISPVPMGLTTELGGTYITAQSSGIPIISRCSVGPSAFSFDINDFLNSLNAGDTIETTKLLDFSLDNPLHSDLSNDERDNDIWTHLSRVAYGMIVPNTRTYLTIGYSGGHESGICYKCTQDDGNLCGGYCSHKADDYYQYYWLWDLNDLLDVMNGNTPSHDVRPYSYGKFETPIQSKNKIGGGTFDENSGLLYLSVKAADTLQGTYSNPPVILAYSFNIPTLGITDKLQQPDIRIIQNKDLVRIEGLGDNVSINLFSLDGKSCRYKTVGQNIISLSGLPQGLYILHVNSNSHIISKKLLKL